jgi:hypothetical protein
MEEFRVISFEALCRHMLSQAGENHQRLGEIFAIWLRF